MQAAVNCLLSEAILNFVVGVLCAFRDSICLLKDNFAIHSYQDRSSKRVVSGFCSDVCVHQFKNVSVVIRLAGDGGRNKQQR